MGVEVLRDMIHPSDGGATPMSAQRLAYASDLTDAEWQLLESLRPAAQPGGGPRKYAMREVLNGIPYVWRGGCAWRLMPHDLPHWQTASWACRGWPHDGTWRRIPDQLRAHIRTRMGRRPQPAPADIHAQTIKTTVKGGCMAMMGPKSATVASAISSLRRRVSCSVSSSISPI